jgi:hypothetical protein
MKILLHGLTKYQIFKSTQISDVNALPAILDPAYLTLSIMLVLERS